MTKHSLKLRRTRDTLYKQWEKMCNEEYRQRDRLWAFRDKVNEKISASITKRAEVMASMEQYDRWIDVAERREKRAAKKKK